ncbi:MAG: type VI secretion system tip protein VgrG [Candidatus Eisenbacteria bacterium]|nr:type VI secretion system tip protein VgrG [Candidatus Eisenbacteria bacterium]
MAIERMANQAELFFECGAYGPTDLRVTRFRGVEAISELFSFDIELASENAELDFAELVGQPATLSWSTEDDLRYVNGILAGFEQLGSGARFHNYRARLVPKAWILTLRRNCKIFQGEDVKAIITKVLTAAGLADGTDFAFPTYGTHPTREYCVQYRETDWDFVARLAEEEGISFFFQHEAGAHKLLFTDANTAFEDIPGNASIPFRLPTAMIEDEEAVYTFRWSEAMRTGKSVLRDYLFTNPALDLTTPAQTADLETAHEAYDYPGEYITGAWGGTLAKYRLEEMRANRNRGRGDSSARALIAGYCYTMVEHGREDRNQRYLLTRVEHWGQQPESVEEDTASGGKQPPYGNSFDCIPAETPFRPERLTPRPRVEGAQTATVVGPAGEEVHVDQHGRVKVHFHWDRVGAKDDKDSCYIRVAQGWAGSGWGIVFIPRIGMEVIVHFLEGDPDQPIIAGCVYNGLNPPPYDLPAEKTKSTIKSNSSLGGGGFNEIRFEDAKNSEQVYIHAQKDMDTMVENNRTVTVGVDETHEVGNDRTLHVKHDEATTIDNNRTIEVKVDDTETIGGSQTIDITGTQDTRIVGSRSAEILGSDSTNVIGSRTVSVGGTQGVSVTGEESYSVSGNSTDEVGGEHSLSVGGDQSIEIAGSGALQISGEYTIEVSGAFGNTVGGDSNWETTGNLTIKAAKITIEADEQIEIKTGSAKITMKSGGDITIEGSKIEGKASGNLTLKGATTKID